jgi:ComF family protein
LYNPALRTYLNSFFNLFFPNVCVACEDSLAGNERYLCTKCLALLPQTNYCNQPGNPVEQLFWGRVPVENGTAFLFFEKGSNYQNIFHQLKYKGRKELGTMLGKLFGQKLAEGRFQSVDLILPVPLHKSRERNRGYNQSDVIASGIAEAMNIPVVNTAVIRVKATRTQTQRNRYDRWLNVEGIFKCLYPALLENKHVLIVDDIITTGATTESLMQELSKIKGLKFSVAALAVA